MTSLYIRNLAANLIGNLIIGLLNIFTPLKFLKDWMAFLSGDGWLLIPIFIIIACIIVTILQYSIQRPITPERFRGHVWSMRPIGTLSVTEAE